MLDIFLSTVRSERTEKTYGLALGVFFRAVGKSAHEVTKRDIEKHLAAMAEQGYAPSTCNTHLAAIQSFYSWAEDAYGIHDVARKIRPAAVPPGDPKCLEPEEVKCLKRVIDLLVYEVPDETTQLEKHKRSKRSSSLPAAGHGHKDFERSQADKEAAERRRRALQLVV